MSEHKLREAVGFSQYSLISQLLRLFLTKNKSDHVHLPHYVVIRGKQSQQTLMFHIAGGKVHAVQSSYPRACSQLKEW